MTRSSGSLRAIADGLRAGHARLRARAVPLRGRVDLALVTVLASAVVALGVGGWTFARIEDARGFFDPPVLEEIDDPRILTDYRNHTVPIVDMVAQGFHAFVGRADGTIHRYDMRTGLFAEERLPGAPTLEGHLSFLSSTCTDAAGCPTGATVFGVTETGGLAARGTNGWRTVISDSAWIGTDGIPVELPDVTLWALSDDGRWLLAFAGDKGLGLFDQSGSIWVPVSQDGLVAAPEHLNFADGQFWLGGLGGLETIDPRAAQTRTVVPGAGAVLDLERAADGNLLVLHSAPCAGGTCLSIAEARGATDLHRLVGETSISPDLSATVLSHAALQDGRVVVLGAAGVHVYDPQARSWTVLQAGPVDAFHAGTEGRVILFAAGSNVGRVSGGRVVWQAQTQHRVAQILPGPGNAVLAMLRNGSVVDLAQPGPAVIVPADLGPGDPASISAGATFGETVVLRRGADMILHDPSARRWAVSSGQVPRTAGADARILGTSRALWLVDARQGNVWEGVLDGAWPARTIAFRDSAFAGVGVVSAQADGDFLHLVTVGGTPLRLQSGVRTPEVRTGAPTARGFRPVTAAAAAGQMIFSDGQAIAAYDYSQRGWMPSWPGPPGGVRDLDVAPGALLALSRSGVLYASQGGDWATLSGSPGGMALGSDQLSDAVQAGGAIYLGGAGRVVEYRPDLRRVARAYSNGTGEVRLAGVSGGQPVWTSGARLFQGDRQVSEPAERVVWAGPGPEGLLYAAESNGRLHAVLNAQPRQCLFRGAPPPGGAPVDARGLPDGRVFVATTEGMAIHDPLNRRWIRLAGAGVASAARVEIVAGHLVLIDGASARAVLLTDLPHPGSCDAGVQQVAWIALPLALQVAHDAVEDRVLLLGRDGGVREWRGTVRRLLPANGPAPTMTDLRRVRSVPEGLMFAANDRVWTYEQQGQTWSSRAIEGRPGTVGVIDVEHEAGMTRVTQWDNAGQGYGGESRSGPITLRRLLLPQMPRPTQDPAGIRDMVQDDRIVAILGDRILELFDRSDYTRRSTLRLPAADRGWQIARVDETLSFVVTDGSTDAPARMFVLRQAVAQVAGSADLEQMSFAYTPADDRDWRLSNDGLWRIDRGLVLHHCDIIQGRSAPTDCRAVTVPPEPLEPDSLIAAERLPGGDWLLVTRGAIRRIDNAWRVVERTAIPDASDTSRLVPAGAAVFLWTGQGGEVWRFGQTQVPQRLLGGVHDLRTLSEGLAATTADGLHLLDDGSEPIRPMADNLLLRAATVDAGDGVQGLGPDGILRRHGGSGDPVSEVVLPDDVLAVALGPAPDAAGLATPGAIWAQHPDGQIRIHWIGVCRPPEPSASPDPSATQPPTDPPPAPMLPEADSLNAEGSDLPTASLQVAAGQPAEIAAEPEPCPFVHETGLVLEGTERLLQVRFDADGATVLTTRATHALTSDLRHEARLADWSPQMRGNPEALAAIRDRIVEVDGRPFLAPPELRGSGGRFDVDGGAGSRQSMTGGRLLSANPFDLSWLAWDRITQRVRFADGIDLPPVEAIRDGRFLPDAPGRATYLGDDAFALMNSHGLWQARIGREVRPVRMAPSDLPLDLAGGRFLFQRDGVDARTGTATSDTGRESIALGALRVTETLRGGGVEATYVMDGRDVPALGSQGFLFDHRTGLTVDAGTPLLLTPLGLVPATGLGPGLALPSGSTAVDTDGGAVLVRNPAGWSRRTVQGWSASPPAWNDRLLAEVGGRRWQRRAGTFEIVARSPADAHAVARSGLDFDSDRLRALAADARGIVAVTGSGTIAASSLTALAALSPPAAPDPGVRALDVRDVQAGTSVLWAETAQGPLLWDHATRAWRAAGQGEDPWAFRIAVDAGGLRLAFRQGRAEPSVQVEDLGGGQRHAAFAWAAGQDMPFDRVRGVTVVGDRILLATDMGLRRMVWSGQGAAVRGLYSGVASGGTPLAFDRVGRPASDPARLLVTAGLACFVLTSPDAPLAPCPAQGDLIERAISSDPLWEWRKTDTAISGSYLDHRSQPLGPAQLGSDGYWPHDRLRGVAQCAGTVAELWAESDVVARAGSGLPGQLQVLPGAQAFLCQGEAAELGQGARLAPGFLVAGGGGAWRLSGQGWQPDGNAAAVLERARGNVPWEGARLRLQLAGGGAVQEVRGQDDVWRALPWQGDRPAIDRVIGIAGTGPTLRLLTPSGVLDWSVAAHRLDPGALILRVPDDRHALTDCRPVRIEAQDGSVQAVPRLPGNPVDILCEDGRIWRGDPAAAADVGVFAPALSDIGADRVLARGGGWVFGRVVAGGAESLSIEFRDEAVSLDGGRLSLDHYTGLAAPYADHVEIVTQGAGWWRSPRRDLSVTAARRPGPGAGAETATSLHADARDGSPRLCVQGQDAVVFDPRGGVARAPQCRDVRGVDATYTWSAGPGGAAADGVALNGLPLRRDLSRGRFDDLFVIGAPLPDNGGHILVPTLAGVLRIGTRGPDGTFANPDPAFLTQDGAGLPVGLSSGGVMPLGRAAPPGCGALADLLAHLPAEARVLRVNPVAQDAVEVLVAVPGNPRLPLLVPCAGVQDTMAWALPLNVINRGRYRALGLNALAQRLLASVDGTRLAVADPTGRGIFLEPSISQRPLAQVAAPDARAVVFATEHTLYRMDVDHVLGRIGTRSVAGTVPAPPGPFAPAHLEPEPSGPLNAASPPLPRSSAAPVAEVPAVQGLAPVTSPAPKEPPHLDDTAPLELDAGEWRVVQQALQNRGLYSGRIDGIPGPLTRAGIRAWQAQNGRQQTGVLTERQKAELIMGP